MKKILFIIILLFATSTFIMSKNESEPKLNYNYTIIDNKNNENLAGVNIKYFDIKGNLIKQEYSDLDGIFNINDNIYKIELNFISYNDTVLYISKIKDNIIALNRKN